MEAEDIIGKWFLEGRIPMTANAFLRIKGAFTFTANGTATFDEHETLEAGERVISEKTKSTEGSWTILSSRLLVELPGRSGSPFAFSMTSTGGLQWYTGAVWRRQPAGP
jgi:hypothetical protein